MTRWILHEYNDLHYEPLGEPRSVGVYEDDEVPCLVSRHEAVLRAISNLKKQRPRCIPIAFREGEPVEILHCVYKDGERDAFFQNIELAHCWIELRYYEFQKDPFGPIVRLDVRSQLIDIPESVTAARLPKSVWEWLRQPASYNG